MTSAYLHARDMIQQARTILTNDAWFDSEVDRLLDRAIIRLAELDDKRGREVLAPLRPAGSRRIRRGLMPWLDPDKH